MRAGLAALALSMGLVAFSARAAETLTVCLEGDALPFSYHDGKKAAGFDVAVAAAVAGHLNRDLKIQWFEVSKSPDQDEPDPARSENAMLNLGKCQLVGGFPLIANDLTPAEDKSRLPDFAGETRDERKQWVPIGKLIASKPYYYYPFTVLLGPTVAGHKIASLNDLAGLRIASEDGTLADAILMWYDHRKYLRQVTHYTPGKSLDHGGGLLEHLDHGDFDATLVALRRYDAYRAQHPNTKIVATGYYYRLGFNIGFVAKPSDVSLIGGVNAAVDDLMTRNQLPTMAKAEGMTYVAPRQPAIASGVTIGDLTAGDDK